MHLIVCFSFRFFGAFVQIVQLRNDYWAEFLFLSLQYARWNNAYINIHIHVHINSYNIDIHAELYGKVSCMCMFMCMNGQINLPLDN